MLFLTMKNCLHQIEILSKLSVSENDMDIRKDLVLDKVSWVHANVICVYSNAEHSISYSKRALFVLVSIKK